MADKQRSQQNQDKNRGQGNRQDQGGAQKAPPMSQDPNRTVKNPSPGNDTRRDQQSQHQSDSDRRFDLGNGPDQA